MSARRHLSHRDPTQKEALRSASTGAGSAPVLDELQLAKARRRLAELLARDVLSQREVIEAVRLGVIIERAKNPPATQTTPPEPSATSSADSVGPDSTCANCGGGYYRDESNSRAPRRFCGTTCEGQFRRPSREPLVRACAHCGEEFEAERSTARYCPQHRKKRDRTRRAPDLLTGTVYADA